MTMHGLRVAATSVALLATGCVSVRAPGFMRSSAQRGWPETLQTAQSLAAAGRFAAADSTLWRFAQQHPGSAQAIETDYWRALFSLDPDNDSASVDRATRELDDYLAADGPRPHLAEAMSLNRVAVAMRSLTVAANTAAARARESAGNAAAANARASDHAEHADSTSSSDAEVRRLRDELAKANAELERIRKRLTPTGKPPKQP